MLRAFCRLSIIFQSTALLSQRAYVAGFMDSASLNYKSLKNDMSLNAIDAKTTTGTVPVADTVTDNGKKSKRKHGDDDIEAASITAEPTESSLLSGLKWR